MSVVSDIGECFVGLILIKTLRDTAAFVLILLMEIETWRAKVPQLGPHICQVLGPGIVSQVYLTNHVP